MLAARHLDRARAAADELRDVSVLLHDGDASAALIGLRGARRAFSDLRAEEEVPSTRLLIAGACRAPGDDATADLEEAAARTALMSFRRSDTAEDDSHPRDGPDGLTSRGVEVLRLLARGTTTRVIGESLFISEKTVGRTAAARKGVLRSRDAPSCPSLGSSHRSRHQDAAPVTAPGSGLELHISVANARLQARRVARARGLSHSAVLDLIEDHTDQRALGFLGEPGVNVLGLNLALDRLGSR